MKKQRAVDYFFSQLTVVPVIEKYEMKGIFISLENYHDILETAEAMEREQIEQAYIQGCWDEIDERMESCVEESCKRYYINTYKGGEQ